MAKLKLIDGLNCETDARSGVAFVLRAKLDQMCQLRDAALDFTSPEGVHKMRVASRRLRSALRDFQPYLSKEVSPKRLRAVARALGAVRDEDVAIEMMEGLLAEADEEAREGIERLIDERRARREEARASLADAISDGALTELREKFISQLIRAAAESSGKGCRAPQLSAASFSAAGAEIVRGRFDELKECGRGIYQPFEAEQLHEMRIRAKRLRYAIELFTQCWGESVAPYAAEVEKLQEYLGELHDCDVWIADLGSRLGRRGHKKGVSEAAGAAERRAAVWLLSHFVNARTRHYSKALALWDGWEAMNFGASLVAYVEEARTRQESPVPASEASKAVEAGQEVQT